MGNLIRFFVGETRFERRPYMQENELILQFSYNLPIILVMLKKLT